MYSHCGEEISSPPNLLLQNLLFENFQHLNIIFLKTDHNETTISYKISIIRIFARYDMVEIALNDKAQCKISNLTPTMNTDFLRIQCVRDWLKTRALVNRAALKEH